MKKFIPLSDAEALEISVKTNQLLHEELTQIMPDGIKTIEVEPIQVKVVYKALWRFKK